MPAKKQFKISDDIRAKVIADAEAGMSNADLSEKHQLGRTTISSIIVASRDGKASVTKKMIDGALALGLTRSQAARYYNVAPQAFSYACRKHGIDLKRSNLDPFKCQPRMTVKARVVEDVARMPEQNDNRKTVAIHPIMATEGRWADLSAYAASHGITAAKAQQLWHKARAGVL